MLVRCSECSVVGWMLVVGLVAIAGYAEGGTAQQEGKQLLVACGLQEVSFERHNNELSITYAFSEQFSDKLALALVAVGTQDIIGDYDKVCIVARREGQHFLEFSTSPSGLMHFAERNAGPEAMAEAGRLLQQAAAAAGAPQIGQSDESADQTPQTDSAPLPTTNKPPSLQPGFASELGQALVGAGLENVAVRLLDSGQVTIEYENRTYRSDVDALSTAARIASQHCSAGTVLYLTAKRDNVPVITVTTKADKSQQLPEPGAVPEGLRETRPTALDGSVADSSGLLNESFGRFDLSFRPALSYQIGNWRRPVITDWFVLPQLTTTIAPGWRASLRGRLQLDDPDAQLERMLLTRTGRVLDDRVLWTGSVGRFDTRLRGAFGEAQLELGDGRAGVRLARVGRDNWDLDIPMWLGYYEHEFGNLGLTVRATAGQFADYIDPTGLVELDRRFGESTLRMGLTIHSPVREGIVRVTVPFGPRRVDDPGPLRLRTSDYLALSYFTDRGTPGTEMLRGDHDLRAFRGELTGPYLNADSRREANQRQVMPEQSWNPGPSHEGISGLIRIPTADVIPDGSYRVGASFIDSEHTRGAHAGRSDMIPTFVNVGLLPGLEMGFRLSIFPDVKPIRFPNWHYSTDRSIFAHYQLWPQHGNLPAVAIGAQDISFRDDAQVVGCAEYIVVTQQLGDLRLHLGRGTKRLSGLFGGAEYRLSPSLAAIGEYDTDWFNYGLRAAPDQSWRVDLTLTDSHAIGGAVSYLGVFP